MANLFNKSKKQPKVVLMNDEYWDVELSADKGVEHNYESGEIPTGKLISWIDVNSEECMDELNRLFSKNEYLWSDAVNEGVELENIGLLGIDNGLIKYHKDRISNKDFLEILTGSTYTIPEGMINFYFTPVDGNTKKFSYKYKVKEEEDKKYIALNGGFFQGFSKLSGYPYQVLPTFIDDEWNFTVRLRPRSDYEVDSYALNSVHPENKGIFLYLGTRAENKFWFKYKVKDYFDDSLVKYYGILDDYFGDKGYQEPLPCYDDPYADIYQDEDPQGPCVFDYSTAVTFNPIPIECVEPEGSEGECSECNSSNDGGSCTTFINTPFDFNEYGYREDNNECSGCPIPPGPPPCCYKKEISMDACCLDYYLDNYKYPEDFAKDVGDYFGKDISLKDLKVITSNGFEDGLTGYFTIRSDNKFLTFNRTETGFTVSTWEDGKIVEFTGTTHERLQNYFLLFDRTNKGYNTKSISKLINEKSNTYNVLKDLTNNAIAFKVNDDNSIGYRYLIKNLGVEKGWQIVEEKSKPNAVKDGEWSTVNVKMKIVDGASNRCDNDEHRDRRMRLYFYVNGFLVFISRELPEPNFRKLADVDDKQETVPYNISLGGGTQGLCDSVWTQFMDYPDKMLPLEKYFGGTFIGDISSFKFYNGIIDLEEIRRNVEVDSEGL